MPRTTGPARACVRSGSRRGDGRGDCGSESRHGAWVPIGEAAEKDGGGKRAVHGGGVSVAGGIGAAELSFCGRGVSWAVCSAGLVRSCAS